ncbi:MAG: peptidylprolyl isomerase [Flavobacteriaceae bacterium]
MIKLRHIFLLGLVLTICYGCPSETQVADPYDHAGQAVIDKDSINKFLLNHYFDDTVDSIKPLVAGKQPLSQDSRLIPQNVTENEIKYVMYHLVIEQGTPVPDKPFPTQMDSVLSKYQVWYFQNPDSLKLSQTGGDATWFSLAPSPESVVIRGWSYGFPFFKGGENITNNGPINYTNTGKGILIIPSGLAYRETGRGNIPSNAQLLFYINMFDHIVETDHDNDGIASSLEVENSSQNDPRVVDTDGDRIANYLDTDDDGDGVLTKDEDANGDGDPSNDFSDPNNPTLPDYLNPDIK